MGWSLKIARIGGTEIKIHVTFLLLLAWIGFAHYQTGGWPAAWEGMLFIVLLFACVVLHEFGHVVAARRFGIQTPDITLLPIGGVARLQRMPDKPAQELVVALAGPAVNVVIAGILFLILGHLTDPADVAHPEDPRIGMLSRLAWVNVWLVLFNLIPAFPMDGGRVLRALLAMNLSHARATQIAASIGQGLAFLFGFIGLFYNPLLIFIAVFLYMGAAAEAGYAQMKEATAGMQIAEAMTANFTSLPPDAPLVQAVELLRRTKQSEFPVVSPSGELRGILTRDDLIRGWQSAGPQAEVASVMHPNIPVVKYSASFDQAFRMMQDCQCPGLGVVGADGRLVGLVTPETIGEMMMMRSLLPRDGKPSWRRNESTAA